MKALKHLNKYFFKYKWKMLLGLIITVLARVFAVYVPQFVGDATNLIAAHLNNEIQGGDYHSTLIKYILIIFGAALLSAVFTFLMRQTFIVVSRSIEFDLKNEIYEQYQHLSLNFYKKNRTGDLMNRISTDVSKVRLYLGPALMNSVSTGTMFIIVIIFMLNRAPLLTLYSVLPFPILSFAIYKLSVTINKRSTIVQEYLSKLSVFTQENFSGISVIKSYGLEDQTNADFAALSNESKEKNMDLAKVRAFFLPLIVLLIGSSNILVIYIGGQQLINGQIDHVGTIVEFLLYVNMLTFPVIMVGWITTMVQQAEASQKRINEFLKVKPEIVNKSDSHQIITGDIAFQDVSFTYEDTNITALKKISFSVESGKTLAIIGKTGAGKSTILELLGRLYDIETGRILIDGRPIDQINLADLRKAIGYVPQDAFLFSDSIKNNIRFGNADASDEEVIQAAKTAAIHENIMEFGKGYDTVLGERGITLSGGQKQRLSIARAILQDPQIYLFDDCLSAVDTETEEKIIHGIGKIAKGKTMVIVSHRVSSVKDADMIVVLEDGRIVERGTHDRLIGKEGFYRELYEKQLSEKDS